MQPGNRRAILAALLANLGIFVAKLVGWLITGAASMLAEAVHSLADTGNQALLLWGGVAAARTPSESHPFGYGRERYFWAFVVALVIFSLGALFAIYEGVEKLAHPHALTAPEVALGILAVSIALEAYSFRTAVVEARAVKHDASWWDFVRRTKSPELPVVLLEDLGALLGLALAALGILLALVTGDARFDALGSIAIGLLLGAIAVVLAAEMKSLLIGEAASPDHRAKIRAAMEGCASVRRVIYIRSQHIGPDDLLVGAKLEFDASLDLAELSRAIDAVELAVRAAVPIASHIFIEPDIYRPEHRATPIPTH